jgi:uncharacterized membrane protein
MTPKPPVQRLPYLDWLRGLATVIMLQGHVYHSFLRTDLRGGGAYLISQFVGGMPPAIFLFLLGITFAFLMDGMERRGAKPWSRVLASMRRCGYLFGVAFAFRVQQWAFSFDKSPWTDIFRVDILNVMGMSLLLLAPMAFFRTAERMRLCAILGTAIALATPVASMANSLGAFRILPAFLAHYIPPDHLHFGIFPWSAFVAYGLGVGSVLRTVRKEDMTQVMAWFGWGGLSMAFGSWSMSQMSLTIYPGSDFWFDGPALIFIKTGTVLMLMAFAYVWNLGFAPGRWNWLRQFGVSSLFVYWVHVELVYGRELCYFKESLSLPETTVLAVVVVLVMLGASYCSTNWNDVRNLFSFADTPPPRKQATTGD